MTQKDTHPRRPPAPPGEHGKDRTTGAGPRKAERRLPVIAQARPLTQDNIDRIMGAEKAKTDPEQKVKAAIDSLHRRSNKIRLRIKKNGDVTIKEIISDDEQEDEGFLNETLKKYLRERDVAPELWNETAAEIERVIRKKIADSKERPLWDDRARYPELADLSAPEFLKRVWADQIGSDGSIERAAVSQKDKKLLALVDAYIGRRKDRRQDAGAAAGLRFIRSHVGRPRVPTPT
jgi:hypothetical protein